MRSRRGRSRPARRSRFALSNCLARTAVAADPGVFTVDGYYAAALNQDGSFNSASNPAQVGSTVTVFATGLGAINPPQPDGAIVGVPLPANVLPVEMFWYQGPTLIELIPMYLAINYAGPAPGGLKVFGISYETAPLPSRLRAHRAGFRRGDWE